jgi:hypothetical protein
VLKVEIAFARKEFRDCCKALSSIPSQWKSMPPSSPRTKCRASAFEFGSVAFRTSLLNMTGWPRSGCSVIQP